jgi:hypothetical protein
MGEPSSSQNRDRDIPRRTGDGIGSREPLSPPPIPGESERRPTPEEETYERDQRKQIDEEKRSVEDA